MPSPLKPLLCRHEFYWSERHRADRCHRCGKTRAAELPDAFTAFEVVADASSRVEGDRATFASAPRPGPMDSAFFDIPAIDGAPSATVRAMRSSPSAKVLKAQALERREKLLALLDRLAEGGQPSRQDSLDVVLAVIEDAHSADPVLFGPEAVAHFARLHEARSGLIF
ncbi:hypothetical protein [Brevundimonas sp.]|uniref:hypothetical protein n=1 Tax=Brevundimonas sp. TaxID=1871086 RepID=UPI0027378731|nr:hypothetical protein [Brevundimonas sp.]MDP3801702.1 hypothetical protein [Brevundimonas sp.]